MNRIYTWGLLLLLLNIIYNPAYSQKERYVWCFGDSARIDFASGTPVSTGPTAMRTTEGTSSIADRTTGQLLFYTDGVKVWNRNDQLMPGWVKNLGGCFSTTQSALIVPMPGSSTKYYLFGTDAQVGYLTDTGMNPGGDSSTNYSIIDMTLDGGLGDIAQQPVKLLQFTAEKIAATPMSNGKGYWIVLHTWNSNSFYAYPLTSTGFGAPVISQAGSIYKDISGGTDHPEVLGYMRISPDGSTLAAAVTRYIHTIEVFHFNNATGVISGPFFSDATHTISIGLNGPYGICFSPGSRYLYTDQDVTGDKNVYQYDLQAGNSLAIKASMQSVGTPISRTPYAMQTGPDNKIYIVQLNGKTLDRINDPDSAGYLCNYEHDAVSLNNNSGIIALPEFAPALPGACQLAPVTASADKPLICSSDSSLVCGPTGAYTYHWNTNDTTRCIRVKQAGNYYVTVTDINSCSVESNHVPVAVYPVPSISIVKQGDTLSSFGSVTYQWLFNDSAIKGATGPVYVSHQPGDYSLQVTDTNGCTAISNPVAVTTGIADMEKENVLIYPNPSTGLWQLTVANELIGSELMVFDEAGRIVYRSEIRNAESEISLSVSRGIYYLRIANANSSVVRKLVKM